MTRTLAIVVLLTCCNFASAEVALPKKGSYDVSSWEISKADAVKLYFQSEDFTPLIFSTPKEYDNRIYSHLIAVSPDVARKTEIIRSKTLPQRDLLFIDGRLLSLIERQPQVDSLQFKMLFVSLKDTYGIPSITKENEYTVYTFKTDKTQAILLSRGSGDKFEVKIYLYSQSIFRRIFIEQ
jgi:hypothetical protein